MSALCFNESGGENISLETKSIFSLKKEGGRGERERVSEHMIEREKGYGIRAHQWINILW